jgi:hypothetical protein
MHRVSLIIGALLAATACGSTSTTPTNTPNTFHAEVTDPAGDAVASAAVPTPPDLIHGTVDVGGGSMTVTIQFAPGTLNRASTLLTIQLDTDQNPATGIPAANGIGIDYVLSLYGPTDTIVQQATPSTCVNGSACYTQVGTVALNIGTDTMTTTIPLSMLGNAGGRLNYRVFASVPQPAPAPTITTDVMPDITLPPAHVP